MKSLKFMIVKLNTYWMIPILNTLVYQTLRLDIQPLNRIFVDPLISRLQMDHHNMVVVNHYNANSEEHPKLQNFIKCLKSILLLKNRN